jgi:hypothetical protein
VALPAGAAAGILDGVNDRRLGLAFSLTCALLASGCAGKPFDVKVVPKVAPEAVGPASASAGVEMRAAAYWDEEFLLETFDANLILAGVLPVRVDLANGGAAPLAAKKLRLELTDGQGRAFEALDAKKAMKAIESYYALGVQSQTGRKLYQQDFAANAIDLKTDFKPGERRQGLVFFRLPRGVAAHVPATLRLTSKADKALLVAVALP